jgi:hypothetical protein
MYNLSLDVMRLWPNEGQMVGAVVYDHDEGTPTGA